MQLASDMYVSDGLLATLTLLSEKTCHGVSTSYTALPQCIEGRNSTALIGLRFQCSGTASEPVVAPSKAPPGMIHCSGTARVLQGNSAQIGHPGGWSGSSVGPINVTANGAAIIPSQWGVTNKGPFRQYLNQISGVFPNAGASFQGVSEIIGGAPVSAFPNLPVQQGLMARYPGMLILELPGGQDLGVNGTAVTLTVPSAVGCPAGTSQVP